ncbi:MAG: O-antigen ligase family protein [Vicinamibacterales bacterium]
MHRLLLAVVVLDIPFRFENNLLYRADVETLGSLGGFNVSVTTVALLLLYVRWAMVVVALPDRRPASAAGLAGWPLAAYLGFATLSTVLATDVALALRELFLLTQVFLLYRYVVTFVSADDLRFLMKVTLVALALESLAMLYGAYVGDTVLVLGRRIRVDAVGTARVGGTVGSPNGAATYLSLLIAPAIALLLTPARPSLKAAAIVCAALAANALVTTLSRGGWIAVALSLTVFWFASYRYTRRPLLAPLAALGLAAAVLAFSEGTIAARLMSDDNSSARSRLPLMRTAMKIVRDHPLMGVGPNNYSTAMKDYEAVYGDWGDFAFTVHNKFLLVWAETGPGGLITFVWFLVATIRMGWRGWRARDPWLSPIALGITAALLGHVVHLQVDLFSDRSQVELLWLLAALVSVIYANTRTGAHQMQPVRELAHAGVDPS